MNRSCSLGWWSWLSHNNGFGSRLENGVQHHIVTLIVGIQSLCSKWSAQECSDTVMWECRGCGYSRFTFGYGSLTVGGRNSLRFNISVICTLVLISCLLHGFLNRQKVGCQTNPLIVLGMIRNCESVFFLGVFGRYSAQFVVFDSQPCWNIFETVAVAFS